MSVLGVLFAIILVCALIGTENILKVLFVGIIVVVIGYFLLKKWSNKYDAEMSNKESELKQRYFSTNGHHSQSYDVRPIVTGDYFRSSWQTQDDSASVWQYCQYANSTTCANCARRNEHIKEEKYYYGVSDKCREYYNP